MSAEHVVFKLKVTPNGKALWTYMAAILEVTEMDKGNIYPLNKILSNFRTHLENNRIVRVDGGYQLTKDGIEYFADRYNENNNQRIYRNEVDVMIKGIVTGNGSDEWEKIQ